MSFFHTRRQIEDRSKTVTRRTGWADLKPGTELEAIEKGQGLKKGERVKVIGRIRVRDVRRERLDELVRDEHYGHVEMAKEGFPGLEPREFVERYFAKADPAELITRVEFEHL